MAGFENYQADATEIEHEIERKGIAIGIDWSDEVQVRALAREAFAHSQETIRAAAAGAYDPVLQAKADLFGLAAIMLQTMKESAEHGLLSHGGPVWKTFAKALWAEAALRNGDSV